MNIYRTIIFSICLFSVSGSTLYANYAFKKKVKNVCKTYRITVESEQFDLGDNLFSITLESGRNNFEMYMIVGFAAAGQAVAHQKKMGLENAYIPNDIQVSVRVPSTKDSFNTFIARCSWKDANKLAEGTTDSAEFMQTITKTLKIM